jgi:hypothetical protein
VCRILIHVAYLMRLAAVPAVGILAQVWLICRRWRRQISLWCDCWSVGVWRRSKCERGIDQLEGVDLFVRGDGRQ